MTDRLLPPALKSRSVIQMTPLPAVAPVANAYQIELGAERLGRWHLLVLHGRHLPRDLLIRVHFELEDEITPVTRFLSTCSFMGLRLPSIGIISIPLNMRRMSLEFYGGGVRSSDTSLDFIGISQTLAAVILTLWRPSMVLSAFRFRQGDVMTRLRRHLAMAAVQAGLPTSYRDWIGLFGHWTENPKARADATEREPVLAVVFTRSGTGRRALQATLQSLKSSTCPTRVVVLDGGAEDADKTFATLIAASPEDHVALLQAGETVEPYAVSTLRRVAVQEGRAAVYADHDQVASDGARHDPIFTPQPNRTLLLSGLLTQGLHVFRRDALAGLNAGSACWAETARLDAWLRLDAKPGPADGQRLPFLLTHRRHDTQGASPQALAAIGRIHLGPDWIGQIDDTAMPVKIRPGVGASAPLVSLVVASTGRLPHVPKCLGAILSDTDYPNFEVVIVISQKMDLDAEQQSLLSPLLADPRVRVVMAPMQSFNYSRANNIAIRATSAPLVCLLNDDVAPITPDWLSVMVGHLQDARVGAVGAKLYYPNSTVQHGGVIMGLCGLCDHAFRFLPRGALGYGGRGVVDQELSAVTGACLLVRRTVYAEVAGLDEGFATAFNDVDFCMKIRAAGHAIVWSAQAELFHHETVSLGSHYNEECKELEAVEIGIVRGRYEAVVRGDPFHNPNLSLERNSEWQIAFPPRVYEWAERAGLRAGDPLA